MFSSICSLFAFSVLFCDKWQVYYSAVNYELIVQQIGLQYARRSSLEVGGSFVLSFLKVVIE